ncbi:MAG: bifunctional oligoribonuclease/PAP phosphatase NrnA [Campylobacterales bacterium]|nr:bifunctional oligoribonuclease/PAP phosphatase NrnA [Campylobacterales bacterium]
MHRDHDAFKKRVDSHTHISIITHINPDPDTIGTALGVAHILKKYGKSVEVVNASKNLPYMVDFLEGYNKIKSQMQYDNALIIACDCGDTQQFGFDVKGREIINIDHHFINSHFGVLNIVNPTAVSASQSAFELFEGSHDFKIDQASATAFYTALLSDTKNFTTNNVTPATFELSHKLLSYGVEHLKVSQNLNRRNSLASMRIMAVALNSLELHLDAKVATMIITQQDIEATGATLIDMKDISQLSDSMATTLIGITIVELDKLYKVSLRSKYPKHDVATVAASFGGGGHKSAAGFRIDKENVILEQLIKDIIVQFEQLLQGEQA